MGITNKGQESLVKGHNRGFLPLNFPNSGYLECYAPSPPTPKWHVFLEFLVEKKAFCFSKRALHAGTARNKWLKISPAYFSTKFLFTGKRYHLHVRERSVCVCYKKSDLLHIFCSLFILLLFVRVAIAFTSYIIASVKFYDVTF